MSVLITNDDGIYSSGLAVLYDVVNEIFDDVYTVAPADDKSGAGHSITLNVPIRIYKNRELKYTVSGTPADCVLMAVNEVMKEKPKFVFSGINKGDNLSSNITYSGTVAAAIEGTLAGIRSFAFSQDKDESGELDWSNSIKYLPNLIRFLMGIELERGIFWNINIPSTDVSVKGIRMTQQMIRSRTVKSELVKREDARGRDYFWLSASKRDIMFDSNIDMHEDFVAVKSGYISVTPLSVDLTSHTTMFKLNTIVDKDF